MSTLALSGWATPADSVAKAIAPEAASFDYSAHANIEQAINALKEFHDVEHIIGWSLGGQLALHAIASGALNPARLTLISTPFQFVQGGAVKQAMDRFTFDTFRTNYLADPERTATRFNSLVAKGDGQMREVMSKLDLHTDVTDTGRWLPWLDVLDRNPVSMLALASAPATTIIHGTQDTIVPVAQAQLLAEALPNARVELWEGVAHAPHLHDAARLMERSAA